MSERGARCLFWLLAVFLLLFPCLVSGQTTYYLSEAIGNDGNNGTSPSTPFATMNHTLSVIVGSDIVEVMDGTFGGTILIESDKSGTAQNPTTFKRYLGPEGGSILFSGLFWLLGVDGFTIDRLVFANNPGSAIFMQNCRDIMVKNVSITGTGGISIQIRSLSQLEISSRITIQDSLIQNGNGVGIGIGQDFSQSSIIAGTHWHVTDVIIARNAIVNNAQTNEDNLVLSNVNNSIVRDNLIAGAVSEDGFDFKQDSNNALIEGNVIENNALHGMIYNINSNASASPIIGGKNVIIRDNVFRNNGAIGREQLVVLSKELDGQPLIIHDNVFLATYANAPVVRIFRVGQLEFLRNQVTGGNEGVEHQCMFASTLADTVVRNATGAGIQDRGVGASNCTGYTGGGNAIVRTSVCF